MNPSVNPTPASPAPNDKRSHYYCYVGQEPPAPLAALGAGAGATSYQGWGITCLGPDALHLESGMTGPGASTLAPARHPTCRWCPSMALSGWRPHGRNPYATSG